MRVVALATTREILSGEELYSSYLTLVSGWSHTGVRLISHWCQADLALVSGWPCRGDWSTGGYLKLLCMSTGMEIRDCTLCIKVPMHVVERWKLQSRFCHQKDDGVYKCGYLEVNASLVSIWYGGWEWG